MSEPSSFWSNLTLPLVVAVSGAAILAGWQVLETWVETTFFAERPNAYHALSLIVSTATIVAAMVVILGIVIHRHSLRKAISSLTTENATYQETVDKLTKDIENKEKTLREFASLRKEILAARFVEHNADDTVPSLPIPATPDPK